MTDRSRRRSAAILLATLLATFLLSLLPGSAVACSCMAPEPMTAYAGDPTRVVATGTILPSGRPAVDVAVDRWFQGPGGPVLRLAADGFSDQGGGADCRVPYPAAGSSWVFVAAIPFPGEAPQVNLCTPQARLDTPEGQAMLADAIDTFGQGVAPVASPGGTAGDPASVVLGAVPIILVVAAVGLVFAGVAVAFRRSGGAA